ncbi:MAG: hypothetical protein KJ051_09155 [Thermoleophilia bacterium]|nr:hypothetical protein [Thermoleophilia bacterium]
MLIPRIGAIFLLIGYGFALAQVGRLMYVVASEGFSSWAGVAILLVPVGALGLVSSLLVMWRKPLGVRLAWPFCALLVVVAVITFFELPPVGAFLDDYERASLERGVDVPPYQADRGVTEEEYIESQISDVRSQGALGSVAAVVVYGATVLRGSRSRPKQPKPAKA